MKSFSDRLLDYRNPHSFASRLRAKRAALLVPLLAHIHADLGQVRILDIGGSRTYWNCIPDGLLEHYNLHVTLLNLPGELVRYQEAPSGPRFTSIEGDGCDLSAWTEGSFDLVHSNSVIEHVGNPKKMAAFAREVRRLAPHYYVQTPSFFFPVEPHALVPFFHWLPKKLQVWLCLHAAVGRYPRAHTREEAVRLVEESQLLTYRPMQALFPDAVIARERFMGLTKSYVAIKT